MVCPTKGADKRERTITHNLYGTIQPPNYVVLFLNVQKHRSLNELRYRIISQLARSRFRDGKQNENLSEKMIKQMLKGKRYDRCVNVDIRRYMHT